MPRILWLQEARKEAASKAAKKTQGKLNESTARSMEILSSLDADDDAVDHSSVSGHSGFSGEHDYNFMSPAASVCQAGVYQRPHPYNYGYSSPPPPMWQQGLSSGRQAFESHQLTSMKPTATAFFDSRKFPLHAIHVVLSSSITGML